MPWTRQTLSSLRLRLEERVETVPFWTSEEARLALNEGLACWNLLTGTWKRRITFDATFGSDPLFPLPNTMIFGMRVSYLSSPLAQASLADFFRGRPGWWNETVVDGGDVPSTPTLWAPVSLQTIAIWPRPVVFLADAFSVDGVSATPQLVNEEDPVDLEDGVLDVLLGYALHTLTFKEGWMRFAATTPAMKAFLSLAAEQNGQLNTSSAFRTYMGLGTPRLLPTRGASERLTPALAQAGSLDTGE